MSGTAGNIRDIGTGEDVLNGLAVTGETAQNDFETTQADDSEWSEKINIEEDFKNEKGCNFMGRCRADWNGDCKTYRHREKDCCG